MSQLSQPSPAKPRSSSLMSVESEIGGHEQLKSILLEKDTSPIDDQNPIKVSDSTTLIQESGGDGKFQKLAYLGIFLPSLAAFYVLMMMPMMQVTPDLVCADKNSEYKACTKEQACSGKYKWKVDETTDYYSWITEFGLLCETTNFLKIVAYFFLAGFFFGAILIAPLADFVGRKSILMLSSVMLCLLYLKFVFTTTVTGCSLVLFFVGLFVSAHYCSAITYLSEIGTREHSIINVTKFHLAFPFSGAVTYYILIVTGDWKIVTAFMSLVPLVLLVYITYFAESPRYLFGKRDFESSQYAANCISAINLGQKKKWEFENKELPNEVSQIYNNRNQIVCNQCFLLSYSSSRQYVIAFALLLMCTGFAFSGTALSQKQLLDEPFYNSLATYAVEFLMILAVGYLVRAFGYIKSIFFALCATGALGLSSYIVLLVDDYAHGVSTYLMKICALMAFVASISLAADLCPPRIRGTGFGISIGFACVGIISGGIMQEFYDKLHIVFGIVALSGVVFLPWVASLSKYSNSDDVTEIAELYNGKSKDYKIQISSPLPNAENPNHNKNIISTYEIVESSAKIKDQEFKVGLENFSVNMKGEITGKGFCKVTNSDYELTGTLKNGTEFNLVKKILNAKSEMKFIGRREGDKITGEMFVNEDQKAQFEMKIKAKVWEGEIKKDEKIEKVEWALNIENKKVYGLGIMKNKAHFISGNIEEDNKLKMRIMTENESEASFEGTFIENESIQGKMSGVDVKFTPVSPPPITNSS